MLERYDDRAPLNVGTGEDVTIRELAEAVADVVGYTGDMQWDTSKPDGTPRKLLDVTRVKALGWEPQIALKDGIRKTYEWFRQEYSLMEPQRS
jgi:GDP-L-fucose synthase